MSDTDPILVPLGILEHEVSAGIGAGEALWTVLRVDSTEHRIAVWAGAYIEARVGHVARVRAFDDAWSAAVADEDAVGTGELIRGVGRTGGEVRAAIAAHPDDAASVATVPPDLISVVSRIREKVAGRQVLDGDTVGLEYFQPVAATCRLHLSRFRWIAGSRVASDGLRSVNDDFVPVHAAEVDVWGGDEDARDGGTVFSVVPRANQNPVAWNGHIHGRLN